MRNLLGTIGLGAEHHNAQRVAVLSSHQIGDGGLIVGAVEIGLGERRAEPAKMIDDDIKILGGTRNTAYATPASYGWAGFGTRVFGMEGLP